MSRFHSYINTAEKIITSYDGTKPFAIFLKQFFAAEKKYGSTDRKEITSLCYNYFRIGKALPDVSLGEKIIVATFLCNKNESKFLQSIQPAWNALAALPLQKKNAAIDDEFSVAEIFPFKEELSPSVNAEQFCMSFLQQPAVFIRIRPAKRNATIKKLEKYFTAYNLHETDCVEFVAATKVEDVFELDKEVVVQDFTSQKVLDYLKKNSSGNKEIKSVWDCCAASGGKSILLTDILQQKIDLTVSDIRLSIIQNLHLRFKKAGIIEYKYFIADGSKESFADKMTGFDLIICDAPCSGSGTWSRTPEQLLFFKSNAIKEYQTTQKAIVTTAAKYLNENGLFFYITCSVFKKENEAVATFIEKTIGLQLLEQQLLKGYDKKADSMFVAVFKNNKPQSNPKKLL